MESRSASSSLRARRNALLADARLRGSDFCRRYVAETDAWLRELFDRATAGDCAGLALLAVGGYGRGQLSPGSDLDLTLVHDRRRPAGGVAEALWYPIWDEGVSLDYSVRTPKELRAAMEADLKVALGVLDVRHIAGDERVAGEVVSATAGLWASRAPRWLPRLAASARERHVAYGDVAFLLEPDVKDSRGGLRDLSLLAAVARVTPVVAEVARADALATAGEALTSVRVELQRSTGKGSNKLLLQEQDIVADALDLEDADALMASVAASGRAIAWYSDDGWRRVGSWLKGPSRRSAARDRALEPGLVLRDEEVALSADADPSADPSLALRAAAASAELDLPLSRAALGRLGDETAAPRGVWPPELRHALVRALGAGTAAIPAFEALDQVGVLVRLLPEWASVRNRPQRNAYHRFTVDRHLLETAAEASALVRDVARPDLLLLGALLHDIGKGRGGDHTDAGVAIVSQIGPRLGLPAPDAATLVKLVRLHLLLPDAATRRDLDDPATSETVASAVGDRETLELLAAMSEADGLATGPSAWGPWKASLVSRLVQRVEQRLAGGEPAAGPPQPTEVQRELLGAKRLALVAEGSEVTVVAPDRPGLLATVAGILTLSGVVVRSATTRSDPSGAGAALQMALLVFDVAPAFDVLPEWGTVQDDLEAALDGRLPLRRRLEERENQYARRRRAVAAEAPAVRVTTDNSASAAATVVEVRAPDVGPVLYTIASAITECDFAITAALVSTLGAEVVDTFYVQAAGGGKVSDGGGAQGAIEEAVLAALARRAG